MVLGRYLMAEYLDPSITDLMVSIRWYLGYLEGQFGGAGICVYIYIFIYVPRCSNLVPV